MQPRLRQFLLLANLAIILIAFCNPVSATSQKKKKKAVTSPPAATRETVKPQPPLAAPAEAPAQAVKTAPLPPEKDAQREAWRINVEPYAILGSGRPGKAATDFDKPDGVAFAPSGLLYATDAKNRRVQIWDVKTKTWLAEFGHGIFGGEIVDVAVAPDGKAYVTDQTLNLAYVFEPPTPGAIDEKGKVLGPYDYQFRGTRFGEQGFDKLGGIAIDSHGRIYVVDAHLNEVRRFTPDAKIDPAWQFDKQRPDGDTYLHGCEGIAIDEPAGNLFIASEKDNVIQVFDWETGKYKGQMLGAASGGGGKAAGKSIFAGSVEGLALAGKTLFAVDESAGHVQVFDLSAASVFNRDLTGFGASLRTRAGGYKGFFGHAPLVDFEDKTNKTLQQQVKDGAVIPGQANPPGYFCSPDSISAHTDQASGETYIVIADQCNYRLAVYRWSDIARVLGPASVAQKQPASATETTSATKGGKKKGKKKGQ